MNVEQPVPESAWFKSTYSSGAGGECVEVSVRPATVHVRDSKDTARAALTVDPAAWTAFVHFAAR
ncbi:DUF397 domain-containing protein [Streptomyces spongiicola]|uniref:DUF397 domain-containing protein n=1 Tax=Streptomyces spongiicola TaxID=1690221 RepID=A0A2S1YW09_9ACTN|nr:DUF397 domain-containing protein [Streptomyces spongiicola]AWK08275.1 DUF397 domain-containing protein [Streptomyces spongiicola]GBQ04337.1 DUF397 domain-containing protein [Streptomyces spongiicola]